jgi:hypothetical protein
MKKIWLVVIITFGIFICNACAFEDDAKITIENTSDYEVKNITVIYFHGQNGKQVKSIDLLKQNEIKSFDIEMQNPAVIMNTFTSHVSIEYYINDQKYDVSNEENVNIDDTGKPYTNAFIGGGNNVAFTIGNNSYIVDVKR